MVNSILIGAGALTAGVGAYYFGTKKLVDLAMDRKTPKIMEKSNINLDEHMSECLNKIDKARVKLENSQTQTVETESYDGLHLVGHLRGCDDPKRIIIAMHGWRSTWSRDFGIIADFWQDNNCIVLFAEERAQGNSEGEYMSFGLKERYDCLAWINKVNEIYNEELPIYLGGVSMGATTVLMTAGFELPENVKGVVADCGFTSPDDIWKYVVRKGFHLPYGRVQSSFADKISKNKSGVGAKAYSTTEALKSCRVPILFIHGTDDSFVPVSMTYKNYKACTSPKHLLIVPGAEHGMSYIENKDGYESAIKDFWKNYDL